MCTTIISDNLLDLFLLHMFRYKHIKLPKNFPYFIFDRLYSLQILSVTKVAFDYTKEEIYIQIALYFSIIVFTYFVSCIN